MDKKLKQILFITSFGVVLFAILMNFSSVLPFFNNIISLIMPVIVGGIIAIFVNVPVSTVEKLLKKLFKGKKTKMSDNSYHAISFAVTILIAVLIIFLVCTIIIPVIRESVTSVYYLAKEKLPAFVDYLRSHNIRNSWLEEFLNSENLEGLFGNFTDTAHTLLGGVALAISSTVSAVVTAVFSVIIAIYLILSKNRVVRHSKTLITTYIKSKWADRIIKFCRLFSETFTRFLSGQYIEAVILGALMFLTFTVFKLPYATLVGVVTAVCAIIPYIGAFISCTLSALLIAIVSPVVALKALAVYLVVQFVENQFIYPRVVGANVGLPPLYTLVSALIGGKLFGVIGILFFIPLAATVFLLVKEDVRMKTN